MNAEIKQFDRIHDTETNSDFRILFLTNEMVTVINMDNSRKTDIYPISVDTLMKKITDGKFEIVKEEAARIVDPEMLPENTRLKYQRNKLIVDAVSKYYGPTYVDFATKTPKPIMKELKERSGLDIGTIRQIVIRYLQSGCKEASLLKARTTSNLKNLNTKHKRGRVSSIERKNGINIDNSDRAIMDKYIKKYLSNKFISLPKCYMDMVNECYTDNVIKNGILHFVEIPRPSFFQFRYRYQRDTSVKERLSAKMGKREFRNQRRVLTGSAMSGVAGPGDVVEMDACEIDVAAVSETDRSKAVGSPVVYFMIDSYSKLILGASISYDNNSVVAMTNCLASLVEDKAAILASYGFNLAPLKSGITMNDIMPSNVKPHTIRTDHGSDFISKEANRIQHETGITLEYVPPGTGSYKGIVERSFRAFQKDWLVELAANAGAKKHTGISKHNKQAKLSIEDIRKLMYHFIFNHNATLHQTKYGLAPDMVKNHVANVPAEIWRYGIQRYGTPEYITDKDQYLYSLLLPVNARLTRHGILYKKIYFIPDINNDKDVENAILMCRNGSVSFKIRIDPRDNSKVYYLDNKGILRSAPMVDNLMSREIVGLTWSETIEHQKAAALLTEERKADSEEIQRACRREAKETVQMAKRTTMEERDNGIRKTDTKHMIETRTAEKERVRKEHSITKMLDGDSVAPALEVPDEPKEILDTDAVLNKDTSTMSPEEIERYRKALTNKMLEDYDD